jgi:hypothetical protein
MKRITLTISFLAAHLTAWFGFCFFIVNYDVTGSLILSLLATIIFPLTFFLSKKAYDEKNLQGKE